MRRARRSPIASSSSSTRRRTRRKGKLVEQKGEREILDAAIETLRRRLPPSWVAEQAAQGDSDIVDLVIKTPSNQDQALFLVEVKTDVSPRDVEALINGPWRKSWRRRMGNQPILLVAPYARLADVSAAIV